MMGVGTDDKRKWPAGRGVHGNSDGTGGPFGTPFTAKGLRTSFLSAMTIQQQYGPNPIQRYNEAPKRNRSARHEPVCMPISLTLSLALSLSLLGGLTVLEWKGRVPFTFMSVSLALRRANHARVEGRVPLTRSHCERITVKSACKSSTIQIHEEFISSRSYLFMSGFRLQKYVIHIYQLGVVLEDVRHLHLSIPEKSRSSVATEAFPKIWASTTHASGSPLISLPHFVWLSYDWRGKGGRGDKFPYWEIGSSRLDCGDEVRHSSRLVLQRGETRTGEFYLGTLNVCGGMDDKIEDVFELMKDRRLDILCVNETKRKGVYTPDMTKPLAEWEEFRADIRDILVKCDKNERILKKLPDMIESLVRNAKEQWRYSGKPALPALQQMLESHWVPNDWCKAVIVTLYNKKGSRQICTNYRPISLLRVIGKLYSKIIIERVVNETENKT
ncbi:hypothetical protein EVAR_13422_1 [Eumeta japonica]|uniref:Uncharacterized protein n=1 Tax=Eumeta variegata TaxID=151549 RepID=A0A4C1V658_EUMVA|nr:hypothetical protein EVAR_13422_1 [Eumeta japonica]